MPETIVRQIDYKHEAEIQPIDPDPREDVGKVYLFKIKGPHKRYFTYRIAFSNTALATETDLGPLIKDPIEDALIECRHLINRGLFVDLKVVRGRDGFFEPKQSLNVLIKHSSYYEH